jgi:hypothetical protein
MVEPDHGLERLIGADTVIVPACVDIDDPAPAGLIEAVLAAHESGSGYLALHRSVRALSAPRAY